MKVKRNVIEDKYGGMLEQWYSKKQPVVWQEERPMAAAGSAAAS
jgi:hypothetical protein